MALPALAGPLGRGEDGPTYGMEQYPAANLRPDQFVENRCRQTRGAMGIRAGEICRAQLGMDGEGMVFQLDSHPPFSNMRSFQQGHFYIQDPSTLLAVQELDPQPGESVLDLCAAPGGKTTFIAQRMQNRGRITAQDNQPARLDLIRENCARLGITCVETSVAPSGIIANPAKRFDRVLVDAPCSNTGVMRRRVDLRWRIRTEEIERLRTEQLELLRQAAPRLKPGGTMVYSTCSLEPEENAEVVKQFLAEQPQFKLEQERELLPFVEGVDGAYVAKFVSS